MASYGTAVLCRLFPTTYNKPGIVYGIKQSSEDFDHDVYSVGDSEKAVDLRDSRILRSDSRCGFSNVRERTLRDDWRFTEWCRGFEWCRLFSANPSAPEHVVKVAVRRAACRFCVHPMSGVLIFSPELQQTSSQNRPMVIRQIHRLPEVRLYPPEEGNNGHNQGDAHQHTSEQHQPPGWLPTILPTRERWDFSEGMPPPDSTSSHHVFNRPTLESWSPFHMRPTNLTAFTTCQHAYRNTYRTHGVALQRARSGWVSSAAKSLDLLRQNLQQFINKELDEVIKRYIEKFFTPAIENIKRNNGDNAVSEEHVHTVCKQILEEAKRMYSGPYTRGSTPLGDNSDSETGSHSEGRLSVILSKGRKRKDSDTDSEASAATFRKYKKKGRPPLSFHGGISGRVTPSKQNKPGDHVKKEGPKWDPIRLTKETQFIMGARANKALGFGATRGRLYIKHPDVFKYCGDAEDKQWLYDNNMMPATGGKAYMLILEDIKELIESDEYRNSPGLMLDELLGFPVPEHMLEKMRSCMNAQRTDLHERKPRGRPPHSQIENSPVVTTDHHQFDSKEAGPLLGEYPAASPSDSGGPPKHCGNQSSAPPSPADDMELITRDPSPVITSQYMLPSGLEDVSPATAEGSPSPSDLQAVIDTEPPLSAPFDITECS